MRLAEATARQVYRLADDAGVRFWEDSFMAGVTPIVTMAFCYPPQTPPCLVACVRACHTEICRLLWAEERAAVVEAEWLTRPAGGGR